MKFASPLYLLIFLPLLALAYVYISIIKKNSFKPCISFSRVNLLKNNDPKFKKVILNILKVLKCVSLILIVIALAKPQEGKTFEHSSDQGIDIIVALDTSTSMRSLDFSLLNRMETAKKGYAGFCERKKI
jgi:Ca-activated chloride channel family protein